MNIWINSPKIYFECFFLFVDFLFEASKLRNTNKIHYQQFDETENSHAVEDNLFDVRQSLKYDFRFFFYWRCNLSSPIWSKYCFFILSHKTIDFVSAQFTMNVIYLFILHDYWFFCCCCCLQFASILALVCQFLFMAEQKHIMKNNVDQVGNNLFSFVLIMGIVVCFFKLISDGLLIYGATKVWTFIWNWLYFHFFFGTNWVFLKI